MFFDSGGDGVAITSVSGAFVIAFAIVVVVGMCCITKDDILGSQSRESHKKFILHSCYQYTGIFFNK